jgi:hypothetical protein
METKPKMEPNESPVPGVIPEPIRVHHDSAAAYEGHHAAARPSTTTKSASSPGRRNPASIVLARLLGSVRGDKRPADAHPPTRRTAAAERVGDDAVEAQPDHAGQTTPAAPQTNER